MSSCLFIVYSSAKSEWRRPRATLFTPADDQPPWHVHVYQNGRLVVKWDLENKKPMKGKASARVLTLIAELEAEGRL